MSQTQPAMSHPSDSDCYMLLLVENDIYRFCVKNWENRYFVEANSVRVEGPMGRDLRAMCLFANLANEIGLPESLDMRMAARR